MSDVISPTLKRWKLTLEYDGAGFNGWQRQARGFGVQECLETALERLCQQVIPTWAAGRTDVGVHAEGQVAHCDVPRQLPAPKLCAALNAHMRPHPVRVVAARAVDQCFHARVKAHMRYYVYRIYTRRYDSPLRNRQVWHIPETLDSGRLYRLSARLVGYHDFAAFRSRGCQATSSMRTLCTLIWRRDGPEWHLYVAAPSFLYRQVRFLCGALVDCARHRCDEDQVLKSLECPQLHLPSATAPAHGLTFLGADYANDPTPFVPMGVRSSAYLGWRRFGPGYSKASSLSVRYA